MKKIIFVCILSIAGILLAGCNTVHGFGQDVAKVGDKIQGK
ncbi:entericidin A/B family lipoprotein [Glaciimonas soli]|uniref:Entericidin A/B family lipoprotein n=1 Tax=Glaciimonas soli TaxID=2590999 RepID=A0A843YPK3_9BURK|nr:entericidin A/B family lipoprotein [Glaciimonas soli]MQQ99387.1 entericidin A/B family lipoprotein [Glaciimonas soli]